MQIAHRHALQHHRRRRLIGDRIRNLHEPVRGDEPFLGIASNRPGISDAVAHGDVRYARPDRDHLARALAARREGKGRLLVKPGAVIDIDVIHARGVLLDLGLARPRFAGFHFFPLQDFRTTIGWMRIAWGILNLFFEGRGLNRIFPGALPQKDRLSKDMRRMPGKP